MGVATQTRNVSEYMLVLALCLVSNSVTYDGEISLQYTSLTLGLYYVVCIHYVLVKLVLDIACRSMWVFSAVVNVVAVFLIEYTMTRMNRISVFLIQTASSRLTFPIASLRHALETVHANCRGFVICQLLNIFAMMFAMFPDNNRIYHIFFCLSYVTVFKNNTV